MSKLMGMLTLEELRKLSSSGDIETVVVVFSDIYGRFMGKRFDVDFFLDNTVEHGTHACDYLLTVDMEMEPVQGYRFASWERGYGDFHLVPDLTTLRVASWLPKSAMVLCDVQDEKTHKLVDQAPRSMLKKQVSKAEGMGFSVMAASELEYYIFQNPYREAALKA